MVYRGQVTLRVDRARKGTNYKYLVVKKGKITYEDLSEYTLSYFRGIVNRVLKIPEECIRPGGKLGITLMLERGACHFSVNFLRGRLLFEEEVILVSKSYCHNNQYFHGYLVFWYFFFQFFLSNMEPV